jgi:putative tryptophan/tyrosine transport system substrate-binding protein
MRRREFIALISSAAALPIAGQAQQTALAQRGALPVIGILTGGSATATPAFHAGLSEQGYVEGRNVRIEYRFAKDQYDRLPELASELVSLPVNVIFATPGLAAFAAKQATTKIPIIFGIGIDPVETGLVISLANPGGNVTGATAWETSLTPKLLEMLHQILPQSAPCAFLVNSRNSQSARSADVARVAAKELGRDLIVAGAGTESEIDQAFEKFAQRGGGVAVAQEAFLQRRNAQIAALGLRYKLPVLHSFRPFAEAGGLISYAAPYPEIFRQIGSYVGKVLNGASPASLPVLQPTKYELIVNLKTARALGIDVPTTILVRADEVIE